MGQKQKTTIQMDDSKEPIQEQTVIEKAEVSVLCTDTDTSSQPIENDVPENTVLERADSIDGYEYNGDRQFLLEEQANKSTSNELIKKDQKPVDNLEQSADKLYFDTVENDNEKQRHLSRSDEIVNQSENNGDAKILKKEKDKQMILEMLEAENIQKQKKIEAKKHQDDLEREAKIKHREKQKQLKVKWIQQEQIRKKNKNQGTKEREKIEETTIRVIDYPKRLTSDFKEIQTNPTDSMDNVNSLLMEYAESVSSDIMKEAKGRNTSEYGEDVTNATEEDKSSKLKFNDGTKEPEMHETTQISSKDEGLQTRTDISDEKHSVKDTIPVIPHANVETLLRIIKETDDEFKEKEQQLLDDIERKKKEDNIKEMEKELKRQKRDQEKLRKQNEK